MFVFAGARWRGAQLHHFPTRASLVLAAVEQLSERRAHEIRAEAGALPPGTRFGRELYRLTVAALGVDDTRPGVRAAVQATLDLLRGLGVANLLTDDSVRRAALLAHWKEHLSVALTDGGDG